MKCRAWCCDLWGRQCDQLLLSGNQIFTPGRQPGPQDRSSRVSPGLPFSASIKNNSFMSNVYLDCGLDSRLVWWRFKLIKKEQCLFLELLVNNFVQISVKRDDPNKSSAVFYWLLMKYHWSHGVCRTDFSRNQLLCPKTFVTFPLSGDLRSCARQRNRSIVHLISEHANTWNA